MRLKTPVLFGLLLAPVSVPGQTPEPAEPPSSACHIFIDDENIWTVEVLEEPDETLVPILNIITFTPGRWDLRPSQIRIQETGGDTARIDSFSMDTGVPDEPMVMGYLAVRGNSFVGLDLIGDFEGFAAPARVTVDLGRYRFELQPVDCSRFDQLAAKIDQVNFDSPNLWEDFRVLGIQFTGQKIPRPE